MTIMLTRILGPRRNKGRSTQDRLAQVVFELNQRRLQLYIPWLQNKIAELQARIEEKVSRS
jgi:hypothetical protein